jgi:hypothetical protein
MIEASTQFMVGSLSTESGKCNSFNLDGIFGNDTQPVSMARSSRRVGTIASSRSSEEL